MNSDPIPYKMPQGFIYIMKNTMVGNGWGGGCWKKMNNEDLGDKNDKRGKRP